MPDTTPLPPELESVRNRAISALTEVSPAGAPRSAAENRSLTLSTRTNGGEDLPPYYLVYFLLVDLLGFPKLGYGEKVAWIIPIRFRDRLYSIEHRKSGIGIFAPNHDPAATMGTTPSAQAESDAQEIASAIRKAVSFAAPYFVWRAEKAVTTSQLNVLNTSDDLFDRYVFFRDRYRSLLAEAEHRKDEQKISRSVLPDGTEFSTYESPSFQLRREASWNAQAAIDAFFSWTEHTFIHIAILQGRASTGEQVASLAGAEWKVKFKSALDLLLPETKRHYDVLLELRVQIRNFMAHGAFGKKGEAFQFHSGAGAIPVLLTQNESHPYAFSGRLEFDEGTAIDEIEEFITYLWSGPRAPAKTHIFSGLPSILMYAVDGTYEQAMASEDDMAAFVDHLLRRFDDASNMDW